MDYAGLRAMTKVSTGSKTRGKTKNKGLIEPDSIRPDFLTRFQVEGDVPKAVSPLSVRLPADLDAVVRSLPNRTEWLRDAILEKLQREASETTAA